MRRWGGLAVIELGLVLALLARITERFPQAFNFDDWLQFLAYTPTIFPHDYVINHFLSRTLAYSAMAIFGQTQWAAQLPHLILSFAFVLFTALATRKIFSPGYRILILLNLLTNEFFLWAFLSTRGYVEMLFLTTAVQFLIFQFVSRPLAEDLPPTLRRLLLLALLSPFTYFFTLVHVTILLTLFLVWCLKAPEIGKEKLAKALHPYRFGALIFGLLGIGFVLVQGQVLFNSDAIFPDGHILWANALAEGIQVGGTFWLGWTFSLVIFLAGTFLLVKQNRAATLSPLGRWCGLHLLTTLVLFSLLVIFFRVQQFHVRFLLPLIFPLVYLGWDLVSGLKEKTLRRVAVAGLATLFFVAPALDGPSIRQSQLGAWPSVKRFSDEMARQLDHDPVRCVAVTCPAERDHVGFCLQLFPKLPELALSDRKSCHYEWRIEMNRNPVSYPSTTLRRKRVATRVDEWLTLYRSVRPFEKVVDKAGRSEINSFAAFHR